MIKTLSIDTLLFQEFAEKDKENFILIKDMKDLREAALNPLGRIILSYFFPSDNLYLFVPFKLEDRDRNLLRDFGHSEEEIDSYVRDINREKEEDLKDAKEEGVFDGVLGRALTIYGEDVPQDILSLLGLVDPKGKYWKINEALFTGI